MGIVQGCLVIGVRDRNSVLAVIVPKVLGILAARDEKLHGFGGCCAQITGSTILSAGRINAHRLLLSVYDGPEAAILKVLSVHVTDFPAAMDRAFYRYQNGSVAVLSWRRGRWEDAIMAEPAAPVSIVDAFRGTRF